jgi:endonuclease I
MRKIFTVTYILYCCFALAQDGSPASPYYDGFDFTQTGTALRLNLSEKIITTHTRLLTYQDAENAIKIIDRDPSDSSNQTIFLIYGFSENRCPENSFDFVDHRKRDRFADGTGFCEWNREHTYPRSLGNPDLGTQGPGADVHHLRPSDVTKNADRGNSKFGAGSGNAGYYDSFWYPGDEWKGDIARMMMYMYLHYGDQCLPKNVAVGDINATDSNMIDLFLQWNAEDPVSELEEIRNTYLGNTDNFFAQGNRNPFIDNPYLATLIWGGIPAENKWPGLSYTNFDVLRSATVYPNPVQNNQVHVSADIEINSIQLLNTNGQLLQEHRSIENKSYSFAVDDLPKGFYLLKLYSTKGSTTRKIIIN